MALEIVGEVARVLHKIYGTLGYIAPERLRGIEGPASDVYSLGVLLHVLVTNERAVDIQTASSAPR